MMKHHTRPWTMAGILTIAALSLALTAVVVVSADKNKGQTIRLFKGKDLANFYTYLPKHKYDDPNQVFTIVQEDGAPAIRVSGQDFGGFITRQEYANYHLVVEWKWGKKTWPPREGKAMDSGILVHCVGPDGNNGNWMASVESQIIEGGTGDFILVGGKDADGRPIKPSLTVECETRGNQLYYKPGGEPVTRNTGRFNWYGRDPEWKDVQGFRGKQNVEKPPGEWNRHEVICDGDKITNILNGQVVNVGSKCSLTKGKILFQSEGAEIFYRKIELTPLSK